MIAVSGVLDDGTLVPDADELRQLKVLYTARRAKGGAASVTIKNTDKPVLPVLSITKMS